MTQQTLNVKVYNSQINKLKPEITKSNELLLKTLQKIYSKKHNAFTEETSKIALSSNDDKRMQSIGLIETYQYGTIKDLVSENKDIKFNNTMN